MRKPLNILTILVMATAVQAAHAQINKGAIAIEGCTVQPAGLADHEAYSGTAAGHTPVNLSSFNNYLIQGRDPGVIQVKNKEVTIDKGRGDGIREKQKFTIVREGKLLYDQNGKVIGVDVIEIARITITRVEPTIAYGKITKIYKDPDSKKPYAINIGDSTRRR